MQRQDVFEKKYKFLKLFFLSVDFLLFLGLLFQKNVCNRWND
nr:MAG TPA: hypothetical protein [Caudoviricetes sp.]